MFATVLLASVVIILTLLHLKGIYNKYYWTKLGVPFYEKHKTFGPFWQFVTEDRPLFQIFNEIYYKFKKEPVVGFGSLDDLGLYVKHLTNIQHITAGDFQAFNHRGTPFVEADLLANNVLLLHGPKWKLVRQKLTPIFTVAKLKHMYHIIDKSAQDFVEFLKQNPERLKGGTYENLNRFCIASISAAVFGMQTKSIFDSPFREMTRQALMSTFWTNLRFSIANLSDTVFKALRLKLFAGHEKFFVGAIKQVIKQRVQDNMKRHDFVDFCVDIQQKGTMVDLETGLKLEPTDELLAAQAFFFFLAGADPTATGTFGVLMELGRNPDALKRVHEEVDAIFEKCNGQLSYDSVSEMKYLDCVLNESLRLHPPVGYLTRQCVKDSVLPVGNVLVKKGVKIFIPIWELHHDPKYFPEPEKFDPGRFEKGKVSDEAYMPFGKGQRFCIGARYARIQLLACITHLLRNFTVRTYTQNGGMQFKKEQFQVRLKNVDIEFVPRNL